MKFLEALAMRRPMRRQRIGDQPWLYLGEEKVGLAETRTAWREIATGRIVGLAFYDYEADDWESM